MRFDHRAVPIVLAAVLIDTIGFGIVLPVLPGLILSLGAPDLASATRTAGLLLVIYAVTQFFAGPVLGGLSDRYGRRPVLLAAMIAFGIDYALMAAAPSIAWLFIGRAIAGATGAVFSPASAVLADVTPPEKRSGVFSYVGAAFGLGFIVGPALGGVLAEFGPRVPFLVAAGLALANAAIMAIALPETLKPENRRAFNWREAHVIGAFRPLFRAGHAGALLAAWFVWQVAHTVYPATYAFWATIALKWDAATIGWNLAFVGAVSVAFQALLSGRIIAKVGEARAIVIGLGGGAITFGLFAFVTAGWQAYVLIVVSALSGMVFPAMNGALSRLVGADQQGALQGGIGSMGSVANIIGPFVLTQALAGGAAEGFPGAGFLTASALAAAALLIVVVLVTRRMAQSAPRPLAEA